MDSLSFHSINLDLHSNLCIKFRADSFVTSFGTDKPFYEDDNLGDTRYVDWLKSRDPSRYVCFHVWKDGAIIGQLELGESRNTPDAGYIHLY